MYKNKNGNLNNIAGLRIAELRKNLFPGMSQRALADQMQSVGIDIDKNAVQRIECGKRFITDIELKAFAEVLNVDVRKLLW
ncbi:MAG: helix-turn-helix transcriptional regulator [Spirochaetales bacterium]|nr:helix-turn-helix transcriptional regulator [Spirochaetales bacterium]MBR6198919.1 helix-turn-helix transcriptional regulator [Spirochaetales bacterium]